MREVPASVRLAVWERDQGCVVCGSPYAEVHHVVYRSHGGGHTANNLACLCRKHHNMVHEGRLALEYLRATNGQWMWFASYP